MIMIGSRALAFVAPRLLTRKLSDFDFICTKSEFDCWLELNKNLINPTKIYSENNDHFQKMIVCGDTNCEFEIIQDGKSSQLFNELVKNSSDTIDTEFGLIPNLDLLFTLKSSHKYLKNSPHFWKTLVDYHMLSKAGAKVKPEYNAFLKLRQAETYSYKHPNLNQNKNGFFSDDSIKYVFVHDDIHESVALYERPAYLNYIKDNAEVQCDKQKFFNCSRNIQFAGVIEEAAVLAIERSLIPHPRVWSDKYAWHFALSKVCTSITSGWFREFAYENALDILKCYPSDYWIKFQKDLAVGKIRYI